MEQPVTAIDLLGSRTAADGAYITWDMTGHFDWSGGQVILRWGADGVLQSQTGGEIEVSCLRREIRRFLREHAGEQLAMVMATEKQTTDT